MLRLYGIISSPTALDPSAKYRLYRSCISDFILFHTQDMNIQSLADLDCITVLEKIIRFHVASFHQMCEVHQRSIDSIPYYD